MANQIVYRGKIWCSTEKIESRKAAGFNKIHPEVWKKNKFDNNIRGPLNKFPDIFLCGHFYW